MASDHRHRYAARGRHVRRHVLGAAHHRISADNDDPLQRHRNAGVPRGYEEQNPELSRVELCVHQSGDRKHGRRQEHRPRADWYLRSGISAVRDRLDRKSSRSSVDQPPHAGGRDRLNRSPDRFESRERGGQERCKQLGLLAPDDARHSRDRGDVERVPGTHFDFRRRPRELDHRGDHRRPRSEIGRGALRCIVVRSAAVQPSDLRDRTDPLDGAGCPDPHRRKHRTRESGRRNDRGIARRELSDAPTWATA